MSSFNRVLLLGNLTRDPQLSYTPNQKAVCDFGIATNRRWTGQDGSQRDEVCFIDCRMFGKRAEAIQKYSLRGDQLLVEGRLTFESWEAKDGTKRSKLRVTVENFEFMGSPQDNPQGRSQEQQGQSQPAHDVDEDPEIPF